MAFDCLTMLEVAFTEEWDEFTIILTGSITAKTAHLLEEALEKGSLCGKKQVILDCGQLTTLSSKGIGVLMAYLPYYEDYRIALTLRHICPKIYAVLHMLGMNRYLTLEVRTTSGVS
jgi:anti-anti-sigma factor